MLNYLQGTYATDDVIAKAVAKIVSFCQPENMSAIKYSEAICETVPQYGSVYGESGLKSVFIERLQDSIRFSMSTYW